MGLDTFKLCKIDYPLFNVQKGRVDLLVEMLFQKNELSIVNPVRSVPFIDRDDIKNLIFQQRYLELLREVKNKPIAIFMDDFSELTDQKFKSRENNDYFFANYSDVNEQFNDYYICEGLVKEQDIKDKYYLFFTLLRKKWQDVPIVFMHFPIELEYRAKFKLRSQIIRAAIEDISLNEKFQPFNQISVPSEIVKLPENSTDKFPYHYCEEVYSYMAKEIGSLNLSL